VGAGADLYTKSHIRVDLFPFHHLIQIISYILGLEQWLVQFNYDRMKTEDLKPGSKIEGEVFIPVTFRDGVVPDEGRSHLQADFLSQFPGNDNLLQIGEAVTEFIVIFRSEIFTVPGIQNRISVVRKRDGKFSWGLRQDTVFPFQVLEHEAAGGPETHHDLVSDSVIQPKPGIGTPVDPQQVGNLFDLRKAVLYLKVQRTLVRIGGGLVIDQRLGLKRGVNGFILFLGKNRSGKQKGNDACKGGKLNISFHGYNFFLSGD